MLNIFISYHHLREQKAKNKLSQLIQQCYGEYFEVKDMSVKLGDIDPQSPAKRIFKTIREEYLKDTHVTIVILGKHTKCRKHIDWEIAASLLMYGSLHRRKRNGLLILLTDDFIKKAKINCNSNDNDYKTLINKQNASPRIYENVINNYAVVESFSNVVSNPSKFKKLLDKCQEKEILANNFILFKEISLFEDNVEECRKKSKKIKNKLNPENIFAQTDGDLSKYKFNCLTIIEDQKISKLKKEIFDFTNQLENVKRTNDNFKEKLAIVGEIELKLLREDLKNKEREMAINKTKKQNTTDSEFREYFVLKETVENKELELEAQRNIKKELNDNIEIYNFKIEELENTIRKLNNELDGYIDGWMPLSLKDNINRRIEVQRQIDEENLTIEQRLQLFFNISKLRKEIIKECNIESQNVKKIYEEIFLIEDKIFYTTTFVYNDESIFEEIIFFINNEKNELEVCKQAKKYQSIEEYKKDTCLIDKVNTSNISTMPVEELLKEQIELKSKLSKTK